jgi:hypothetical protein
MLAVLKILGIKCKSRYSLMYNENVYADLEIQSEGENTTKLWAILLQCICK